MDSLIVEDLGKRYFVPSKKAAAAPRKTLNLGFARMPLPRFNAARAGRCRAAISGRCGTSRSRSRPSHDPRHHRRERGGEVDAAQGHRARHASHRGTRHRRRPRRLAARAGRRLQSRLLRAGQHPDERGHARHLAARGARPHSRDHRVRRAGRLRRQPAAAVFERHVPAAGVLGRDQHAARHPARGRDSRGRRHRVPGALPAARRRRKPSAA